MATHAAVKDNGDTLDASQVSEVPAPALSLAEALRTEIAAALSAQVDFLKWKLILIAALGGAAFGFLKESMHAPYVLVLVPWVCLYCDLCYWHLHLRIARNGRYFQIAPDFQGTAWRAYESYSAKMHIEAQAYTFERFAVLVSTAFCCVTITLLYSWKIRAALHMQEANHWPFAISGVGGFVALLLLWWQHDTRKKSIAEFKLT